jgi:hypothetical protein
MLDLDLFIMLSMANRVEWGRTHRKQRITWDGRTSMATTTRRYSKEEFASRGDSLYENRIRPQLKSEDEGKFLAIDIESGSHELDVDELRACQKLRAKIPDAQIWMVRIGYRAVHRFGGREQRRDST